MKLARKLKEIGVPVLLTIQIDSVGRKDRVIPSNVARAANFYQHDGPFVRGRSEIVAEDSQETSILGNFKYDCKHKKVDDSALLWLARILEGAMQNWSSIQTCGPKWASSFWMSLWKVLLGHPEQSKIERWESCPSRQRLSLKG